MNPELLDLDLPDEVPPTPESRAHSVEENDRWQSENRRFRALRGDDGFGPFPVEARFSIEDWPLD